MPISVFPKVLSWLDISIVDIKWRVILFHKKLKTKYICIPSFEIELSH